MTKNQTLPQLLDQIFQLLGFQSLEIQCHSCNCQCYHLFEFSFRCPSDVGITLVIPASAELHERAIFLFFCFYFIQQLLALKTASDSSRDDQTCDVWKIEQRLPLGHDLTFLKNICWNMTQYSFHLHQPVPQRFSNMSGLIKDTHQLQRSLPLPSLQLCLMKSISCLCDI